MDEQERIRIVLTPDQREIIRRASGHDLEALDLAPDDLRTHGVPLVARWRLSIATGIPRQAWTDLKKDTPG